jgi:transposase InsO family protein
VIEQLKDRYSVAKLCRVLQCSRNGYYSWINLGRPDYKAFDSSINQIILEQYLKDYRQGIRQLRMNIKKVYGISFTNGTVYRYMRLNKVQSIIRRKKHKYGKLAHHHIPNLLQRDFSTTNSNQKWSIDISYLFPIGRKLYICAIKDLYDKSIIAYTLSRRNDNKLVLDTLSKAFKNVQMNQRQNLILHSDQGIQFTSHPYKACLIQNNVIQSISYRGSCVDNVPIESWFSALKTESVYLFKHLTEEKMIQVVSEYVSYYNEERLQEQLKELTPLQYRELAL